MVYYYCYYLLKESSNPSLSLTLILAIVFGGLCFCILLIGLIVFVIRRKNASQSSQQQPLSTELSTGISNESSNYGRIDAVIAEQNTHYDRVEPINQQNNYDIVIDKYDSNNVYEQVDAPLN